MAFPRFTSLGLALSVATLAAVPSIASEVKKPVYEAHKLSDTLYEFRAMDEGYIVKVLASVGPDGVLLVETGGRQNIPELLQTLKTMGSGAPRIVINSHSHAEHWDGNIALGKGPLYIGHANLRKTMQSRKFLFMDLDEAILPKLTVEDGMSLHFNGEEIRIKAFPGAHDNSDLVIWFTRSKVAFVGALVTACKIPTLDPIGGDIRRYPEITRKVLDYLPTDVKIVPGHGENATHEQGKQFLQMLEKAAAIVKEGIAQGKTLQAMNQEDVLKEWAGWDTSYSNRRYWLSELYKGFTGVSEAFKAKKTIHEPLYKALKEKGPAGVAPAYGELKRDFPNDYRFDDRSLGAIIYTLDEMGRTRETIAFAELLIQEFPKSPYLGMLYPMLGASFQKVGEDPKALNCYRKALELNPKNEEAQKAIQQLETKLGSK